MLSEIILLSSVALALTSMNMEASCINIIQNTLFWNSLLSHWCIFLSHGFAFYLCVVWKIMILALKCRYIILLITFHSLFVNFIVSGKLLTPAWRRQRFFFEAASRDAYLLVFLYKFFCQPRPILTKNHFIICYQRTVHATQQWFF